MQPFTERSRVMFYHYPCLLIDHILYIIIGGVFGGVFLVVMAIAVPALFCYGKQSYNQKKKTLSKSMQQHMCASSQVVPFYN